MFRKLCGKTMPKSFTDICNEMKNLLIYCYKTGISGGFCIGRESKGNES